MIDPTAEHGYDWWTECPLCHHVGLENIENNIKCNCPEGVALLNCKYVSPYLRVEHAMSQGQCARFEQGEDGTPAPFVMPTRRKPMTVYLAGAVRDGDVYLGWRREIFPRSGEIIDESYMEPGTERVGRITYGGPAIISGTHHYSSGHNSPHSEIASRCLKDLCQCDALFVWRIETVGTMIEIGTAFQREMHIFIAFANRELAHKAYFAAQLADVAIVAPSATVAWKLFTQWL
jgi:hypothetical protein